MHEYLVVQRLSEVKHRLKHRVLYFYHVKSLVYSLFRFTYHNSDSVTYTSNMTVKD